MHSQAQHVDKVFRIREQIDDFVVQELPLYLPEGQREHQWLWIEKKACTTEDVANKLAKIAKVKARDVGYAGRKDADGITYQWFSVPVRVDLQIENFTSLEARVLTRTRHANKLRLGQNWGNAFEVVLRSQENIDWDRVGVAVTALGENGCPNFFGEQRFGAQGNSLRQAQRVWEEFKDGVKPRKSHRQLAFLGSVLQAAVFNEVVRARLSRSNASKLVEGDFGLKEARPWPDCLVGEWGKVFEGEPRKVPSGPLVGPDLRPLGGEPQQWELEVISAWGIDTSDPRWLQLWRCGGGRRTMWVWPFACTLKVLDKGSARLKFILPSGSYATVVIDSLEERLRL